MMRKKRQLSGFIFVILISLCFLCFSQEEKVVSESTQIKALVILRASPLPSLEELGKLWLKSSYLTSRELDEKYGPSKEDIEKVKKFALKYELNLDWVMWRAVQLSGSSEDIFKAFGLKSTFNIKDVTIQIEVPEDLKDVAIAVLGLRGVVPRPSINSQSMERGPEKIQQKALPGKISGPPYTPPQLARLYNYPELEGKGECIGVVALAGQYKMEDIETYFKEIIGLSVPEIINVDINESKVPLNPVDSFEVTMDIEVAASIAPKAKIVVYNSHTDESTLADIYELFLAAVLDEKNNPSVLSFSFAFSERVMSLSNILNQEGIDAFDDLFKFAALKGITICAASGDWGSLYVTPVGSTPASLPSVGFPASHPLVLACGGTRIKIKNGKLQEESVWNDQDYTITMFDREGEAGTKNGGASTGGVSLVFPLPGYQRNVNVPLVQLGKLNLESAGYKPGEPQTGCGVPDVSANADFINSPYLIYYDGKEVRDGGGTSAATPLWAGLIACINQGLKHRVGFITPTLYQLQVEGKNVFRKIVKGTNGCYIAGPNEIWNPCTGLGSPDGKKLLKALKRLKQD